MGIEAIVIALAGFLIPIVLVLAASLVSVFVLFWAGYRWGLDRGVPAVKRFVLRHVGAPIGRMAHPHHLLPRSH